MKSIESLKYGHSDLVDHVEGSLVEIGEFTTISKLSKFYKQLQHNKNIPVKGVAQKDIKRRLSLKLKELMFYHKNKILHFI